MTEIKFEETQTVSFAFYPIYYEAVQIHVAFSFLRFPFLFYFIFSTHFPPQAATVYALQPQLLTKHSKNCASVYCSRTHKFHFSVTFSLKMGPTVLFTYLKIILLQYFLVFSCIQMDPIYLSQLLKKSQEKRVSGKKI